MISVYVRLSMAAVWKDATMCKKAAIVASAVTITGLVSYQGYRRWTCRNTCHRDGVSNGTNHISTEHKKSPTPDLPSDKIKSDEDRSSGPSEDRQPQVSPPEQSSTESSADSDIVIVKPESVIEDRDNTPATNEDHDQLDSLPQETERQERDDPHETERGPQQTAQSDVTGHQWENVGVSDIYTTHPGDKEQVTALGMEVSTEGEDETLHHRIVMEDTASLAAQIGLRNNDILCEVNGMRVAHWHHAVLVEQFRILDVDNFEMVIRREVVDVEEDDDDEDVLRVQFKELTVCLVMDGGDVAGKVLKDCPATMDKDFQVQPVRDPGREKSCFIEHRPKEECLHVVQTTLDLAPLQHEDLSFRFFRTLFGGMEDNPNHKYVGKLKHMCAIKVSTHGSSAKYICSQGSNRAVALMSHTQVPDVVYTLQADNRFFFHSHPPSSDDDIFESTQNLDWYLAWDNDKLCLKKYDLRNPDIFNFKLHLK